MARDIWFYRLADLVGTAKSRQKGERGKLRVLSPAGVWRKCKAGTFPEPLKISAAITAWPAAEVDAVVDAMIAGATEEEIRLLVAGLMAARAKKSPIRVAISATRTTSTKPTSKVERMLLGRERAAARRAAASKAALRQNAAACPEKSS